MNLNKTNEIKLRSRDKSSSDMPLFHQNNTTKTLLKNKLKLRNKHHSSNSFHKKTTHHKTLHRDHSSERFYLKKKKRGSSSNSSDIDSLNDSKIKHFKNELDTSYSERPNRVNPIENLLPKLIEIITLQRSTLIEMKKEQSRFRKETRKRMKRLENHIKEHAKPKPTYRDIVEAIRTFRGTGKQSINKWLERCDRFIKLMQPDKGMMLHAMIYSLRGSAKEIYWMNRESIHNREDLVRVLQGAFLKSEGRKLIRRRMEKRLMHRKWQKKRETFQEYAQDVIRMVAVVDKKASDSEKIEKILYGMEPEDENRCYAIKEYNKDRVDKFVKEASQIFD